MKNSNDRVRAARELLSSVREIFGRWDTAGVLSATPGRESDRLDEECVAQIASLLFKQASVSQIAAFLDRLVSKSVGLSSDTARNREFAEQFFAVGKGQRVK